MKKILLFLLCASLSSVFAKEKFETLIKSSEYVRIVFVEELIDYEGINGTCKGIYESIKLPSTYKTKLLSDFAENFKLDFHTENVIIDTNSYSIESIKNDSIPGLIVALVVSGTYQTEQDFSSNQAGFYLNSLVIRADFKTFKYEDGRHKLVFKYSKEIAREITDKVEHAGCMSTINDFVEFIHPGALVNKMHIAVSRGQKEFADKIKK